MGACPSTPIAAPPAPAAPVVPAPAPPPPPVPAPPAPPAPVPTVPSTIPGAPGIQLDTVATELKNAGVNRNQRADMLESLGYQVADIPRYNRLGAPPPLRQSYQQIGTQLRTLGFDPAVIRRSIEILGATPAESGALVLGGKRRRTTRRRKILRGGDPVKYEPKTRSTTEKELQDILKKSPGVQATIKKLIEQQMKTTS